MKIFLLAFLGVVVVMTQPARAEQTGLLADLFGAKPADSKDKSSSKSGSSSSKEKSSNSRSSTSNRSMSVPSSKDKADFLTALTGKSPEERAKEELAKKKAAEAKAREDARNSALAAEEKRKSDLAKTKADTIAAAAKKKEDEQKVRESAAKEKQKAMEVAEKEKQKSIERAADLARKQQLEEERTRQQAEKTRAEDTRKAALAEMKLKEDKAKELLAQAREKEDARRRVEEEKLAEQRRKDSDLLARAQGRNRPRGGFFSSWGKSSSVMTVEEPQSIGSPPNRYLYINEKEISSLNPANSRIEIDLGDQRARIYRGNVLVIETQISSGKSGYSTPTGYFSVQEKLVSKQSGRYGTWYSSSGSELRGDDSSSPPSGASRFVGADMPYWLRFTGGIGMHVGYVPDGPASHGCVRIPSNIQPLIYSKVGIGTPVAVKG